MPASCAVVGLEVLRTCIDTCDGARFWARTVSAFSAVRSPARILQLLRTASGQHFA